PPSSPLFPYTTLFRSYTPYSRWSGEGEGSAVGGVEIHATTFLNLMNGDWLRRPSGWLEDLLFILCGGALGAIACQLRPLPLFGRSEEHTSELQSRGHL